MKLNYISCVCWSFLQRLSPVFFMLLDFVFSTFCMLKWSVKSDCTSWSQIEFFRGALWIGIHEDIQIKKKERKVQGTLF